MPRQVKTVGTPEEVFAKVLREVRNRKGLSQEQLGFDSGYHRNYIGMLERGDMNPTLRTILSLATALEISAGELVDPVQTVVGKWVNPKEPKTAKRLRS